MELLHHLTIQRGKNKARIPDKRKVSGFFTSILSIAALLLSGCLAVCAGAVNVRGGAMIKAILIMFLLVVIAGCGCFHHGKGDCQEDCRAANGGGRP